MGPRTKMLIGGLLIVLGIWWYLPGGELNSLLVGWSTLTNLKSLVVLVQGGIGLFAALIGLFVVWIELDELRLRKELADRQTTMDLDTMQDTVPSMDDDDEEAEHVCDECGKQFDSEHGLNVHTGQAH